MEPEVKAQELETPIHWTACIVIIVLSIIVLVDIGFIAFLATLFAGFGLMQLYDKEKYGKKFKKMDIDDYGKSIG